MKYRTSIYLELIYSPDNGYYYWEIQDPENWQISKGHWHTVFEANDALRNGDITWEKL